MDIAYMCEPSIRDENGVIQVRASEESYFGEHVMQGVEQSQFAQNPALTGATKSQDFAQELYESRIASMQRFVSMCVMFHEMGRSVENFFSRLTFGLLGYRYDRTHSILRVASTASPISGADVRERVHLLRLSTKVKRSIESISFAWNNYKQRKQTHAIRQVEHNCNTSSSSNLDLM